jgi:hypothetical protein
MPFRAWLLIAAFAIALSATLLEAQEQAQGSQGRAAEQEQPAQVLPIPLPIQIIEDDESALARERSEAEARQREIDDLEAQQGMNAATQAMNEATQSMKYAAWVSTGLVALGTCLLIWTLRLTRQANLSARDAVAVTRRIGEAQVRAHLTITNIKVLPEKEWPHFTVTFCIRNTGQTQTRGLEFSRAVELTEGEFLPVQPDNVWMREDDLGPGESVTVDSFLVYTQKPNRTVIAGDRVAISACVNLRFDDVFGNRITETLNCIQSSPWPFTEAPLSVDSREISIAFASTRQTDQSS